MSTIGKSNRTEQHVRDVRSMRERAAGRVMDFANANVQPAEVAASIRALALFEGEADSASLKDAARATARAIRTHMATAPVFRLRPVGAPGSTARVKQDDEIASEDQLREALAELEAAL